MYLPPHHGGYSSWTAKLSHALQHVIIYTGWDEEIGRVSRTKFIIFIDFGNSPRMALESKAAHLKINEKYVIKQVIKGIMYYLPHFRTVFYQKCTGVGFLSAWWLPRRLFLWTICNGKMRIVAPTDVADLQPWGCGRTKSGIFRYSQMCSCKNNIL